MSLVRFVQNAQSNLRSTLTIVSHILKNGEHLGFFLNE